MLERYLDELRREVGSGRARWETEAILNEARDHLDQSIRARLELGMPPEEAEREALAAFGAVRAIGQDVRRRTPRFDRPFVLSVLALFAFFTWAGGSTAFPGWTWVAMIVVASVVHGLFAFTSARVQRPQFAVFAAFLLPVWLAATIMQATHEVTVAGLPEGEMTQSRDTLSGSIARFREDVTRFSRQPKTIIDGYTAFVTGRSNLEPGRMLHFDPAGTMRLRPVEDRTLAARHWENALIYGIRMANHTMEEQAARAQRFEEASHRPWWAEVAPQLLPTFMKAGLPEILGFYGGAHLLFWALGSALRGRRKGPDRRLAG